MPNTPVLLIRAGARIGGLVLADVVETMRPLPTTPLSGLPDYVRGVAIVRGVPTPVIELSTLLAPGSAQPTTRFVTVRAGAQQLALAVDEVLGVAHVDGAQLSAMPSILEGSADAIRSLGALDEKLLIVLKTTRVLSEQQWQRLFAQTESA